MPPLQPQYAQAQYPQQPQQQPSGLPQPQGGPTSVQYSGGVGTEQPSALAEAAHCSPTAASQHLAKLRLAGLVDQRADGRARLYRLRGTHIRRLLDEALGQAEHQVEGIPDDV